MTLYEIDQAIQGLVDPETGELMDYEAFAALQMDRDAKIENMALWYKDLMADAKAIKEEADTLNERRKALENKAERLKSYLSLALDGEKFQTARCSVTFRKTSSIQVSNPEALTAGWSRTAMMRSASSTRNQRSARLALASSLRRACPFHMPRLSKAAVWR